MARRAGELRRRPQEAAAFPLRAFGESAEPREHAGDLLDERAVALIDPAGVANQGRLVARREIGDEEIVLAAEMIIDGALGDAGAGGDRIHARAADALAVAEVVRCLDDLRPGRVGCLGHGRRMYTA